MLHGVDGGESHLTHHTQEVDCCLMVRKKQNTSGECQDHDVPNVTKSRSLLYDSAKLNDGAFAEVATAAVVADVIATDGGVDVNQEGEEQINAQVDDNQENEPLEPPPIQQQTETDDIVTPIDTNENITNLLMFGEQEQLQTNENTTTENDNAEDEQ